MTSEYKHTPRACGVEPDDPVAAGGLRLTSQVASVVPPVPRGRRQVTGAVAGASRLLSSPVASSHAPDLPSAVDTIWTWPGRHSRARRRPGRAISLVNGAPRQPFGIERRRWILAGTRRARLRVSRALRRPGKNTPGLGPHKNIGARARWRPRQLTGVPARARRLGRW